MSGAQDPHPCDVAPNSARRRFARILGLLAPAGLLGLLPGCVNDPDCGVCDPDNLILESIAGVNYAGKLVHLLGPECVGDGCPGELTEGQYFVEKIIPCALTDDAITAGRGADEWCKVSPMVVDSGLQFIFNNLLDPTSVELVRKQARNPQLFEVFDWKTQIVHLEGPITRFNGDYLKAADANDPDLIARAQNLSCIDNLRLQGQAYDHGVLAEQPEICDGTHEGPDGKRWPLRAQLERSDAEGRRAPTTVETWRGETDTRSLAQSCTPPQSGPDLCCDVCDYELSVNVAKYGVVGGPVGELERAGDRRRGFAAAITCDPGGDKLRDCRDFIPHVYRGTEVRSHEYAWDGERQRFRTPRADKIRETHPDDRPADVEQRTVPCQTDEDCGAGGFAGMECVGHLADDPGTGCREGDDCIERRCVAEWFVDCRPDSATTGEQGYCVDRRWSGQGVAACFTASASFYICEDTETCAAEDFSDPKRRQQSGSRLSLADSDGDGALEKVEGCRSSLGGPDGEACDPLFQPEVTPIDRYDRLETLPTETRSCVCQDDPAPGCEDFVDSLCRVGAEPGAPIAPEKLGQYAVKFVSRPGGVIYDPAVKGVQFLPADLGGVPRSLVETCSEDRQKGASDLSIKDGWRANDLGPELFEDADRAMCSSSEYKVVFNSEPKSGEGPLEYIRDKVGNTLRGKSTYVVRTPDFHVVPGSGFPTDNLRIGACAAFQLRFSNKYDLSQDNLRKLEIVEISSDGKQVLGRVAGGSDCSEDDPLAEQPCLTLNIRDQDIGTIEVSIDTRRFGAEHLMPGHRYRLQVPGLELAPGETVFDVIAAGGERYRSAFWDACGMPLVTAMPRLGDDGRPSAEGSARAPDHYYDFTIDDPKPKEDQDQDGVQFSCDNAPDDFNLDQADMDNDGWGDVVDLCATVADPNNKADADKDSVGNVCDRCPLQVSEYNQNADASPADLYMRVRNIPHQGDADQDGVGDVCDNCVVVANCGDFGPAADGLRPAGIGDPVPHGKTDCQPDVDELAFIGDVCAPGGIPLQLPGAAAPVGLTNEDDFDQDGLINLRDHCPRQPVVRVECQSDDECEPFAGCTDGLCNHVDSDNDDHGDLCDSCPFHPNAGQTLNGSMQDDDRDGDFVGKACETTSACEGTHDARRIGFFSEVSNGQCCVQVFDEALEILDPGLARVEGDECVVVDPAVPIKADCPEDQDNVTCRPLPKLVRLRPGVVDLPTGCAAAGTPLTLTSPGIDGDENKLYQHMCLLPQADQDFDGIGDACDLCPFAFDPDNSFFKDVNGKVWPTSGKFCKGDYDPEKEQQSCEDLSGGSSSGESGGSESTG